MSSALTGHVVSVLWPVSDVRAGDRCSRDYVPPIFPGETQSSRNLRERLIMAHYEYVIAWLHAFPPYMGEEALNYS